MTHYLYRFTDADGQLLYVGESVDALNRAAQHKQNAPWFWRVHGFHISVFATRLEAQKAEALAIRSEQPLFNRRFTGRYDESDARIRQERELSRKPTGAIPLPTYDDRSIATPTSELIMRDQELANELMRAHALKWLEQLRGDIARAMYRAEEAWRHEHETVDQLARARGTLVARKQHWLRFWERRSA